MTKKSFSLNKNQLKDSYKVEEEIMEEESDGENNNNNDKIILTFNNQPVQNGNK